MTGRQYKGFKIGDSSFSGERSITPQSREVKLSLRYSQSLRCSYCHDSFTVAATCVHCGTFMHVDCIREHGSCVCGAAFILAREPITKPFIPRVEDTSEATLLAMKWFSISALIITMILMFYG
jgi:hypothetical protein